MRSSDVSTTRPRRVALLEHCREEPGKGGQPADVVADAAARVERDALAAGQLDGEPRTRPEGADVVGRPVAILPAEPVAADTAVDEVGMTRHGRMGLEAKAVEGVGTQVGEEDVGRGEQAVELTARFGFAQVEHDAALAPVVLRKGRVGELLADAERSERAAHGVAGGRFDLDHVGAPVGQQGSSGRGSDPDTELDDTQPVERRQSGWAAGLRVRHRPSSLARPAAACSRSVSLTTLPVAFSGSSSTISTTRGAL